MNLITQFALALELSRHRPKDLTVIIAKKPVSLIELHYNPSFERRCALCDKEAIQLEVTEHNVSGYCAQHRREWHPETFK